MKAANLVSELASEWDILIIKVRKLAIILYYIFIYIYRK